MIVLAIAPGIRTIAWSIVSFPQRAMRGELLGFDLEHHGNKRFSVNSFEEMLSRAKVHWLILEVLLGRYSPGVLAMAGQAVKGEPPEHVEAARCLLRSLFLGVGIPVIEFGTREDVLQVLGLSSRQMRSAATALFGEPVPTRDTAILGTFLTAAAAGRVLLELPAEQPVSRATVTSPTAGEPNHLGTTDERGPRGSGDSNPGPRLLAAPAVAAPILDISSARAGRGGENGRRGQRELRPGAAGRRGSGAQPGHRAKTR